jgi:tetratricopeptide (TPR) repeat protein/predicted Ser/Thr protein kinase
VLSGRYQIVQMLGQGGMGTVYKARDLELDRMVAVKLIRGEMATDSKTLARFKQELILARQITHKNVIRIFDLNTHEGAKYITMEFVEGRDLASLAEGRRFTPDESARIVRQVCWALDAAHGENVIHRDLKPQNIMIDDTGRVRVMDFGLARSVEMSALTQTGALLGTPAYMSPEQAKGASLDHRSDLFSLGIIFYELLTGRVPFQADTLWATLLARTQAEPPPAITIDPAVPARLSEIAAKCLKIDPAARYSTAKEMADELDVFLGDAAQSIVIQPVAAPPRPSRWRFIAAAMAAVVVVIAGVFAWQKLFRTPAAPSKTMTVLVADITNRTGEAVFDGTIEPMLNLALEGAGFINSYDRGQARALANQKLDEPAARLVAANQGLDAVITGSLERRGGGYTLTLKATGAVTGAPIGEAAATVATKDQVLTELPKLAAKVRKALGDPTSVSDQLFAMETLAAASVDAVHQYAVALDALYRTKYEDARQAFSKAVELDPKFGLAYAGLAVVSRNLGQQQDAEKQIQLAISNIDHMTERERYRTRGFYYLLIGDQHKCVEEYGALLSRYPSDARALNQLALCSTELRQLPQALDQMRRAVAILPKHALLRNNLALYAAYAGDFTTAEQEARVAGQLNPAYGKAYISLAFAQLGQGQLQQAADTYHRLENVSAWGVSNAAAGLADLAIYEGRFDEAVQILQKGAAADLAAKHPEAAAAKFAAMAYARISRGQKGPAVSAADLALANSKEARIRLLAARVLVTAGELSKARSVAGGLASELLTEPQVDSKLIEGDAALETGDARAAIQKFNEANALLDTWIGHFDLGRAYLEAGAPAQADSEFDRCIKRRGETLALFLDEVPTYGYFPPVYYYRGRVHEELKSTRFSESYRTYLSIRGNAGEDPLLTEVRRRARE